MSKINCVSPAAYASMEPLLVGTIAMFDVIQPSGAFSVDTTGWFCRPATASDTPTSAMEPPWHSSRTPAPPLGDPARAAGEIHWRAQHSAERLSATHSAGIKYPARRQRVQRKATLTGRLRSSR